MSKVEADPKTNEDIKLFKTAVSNTKTWTLATIKVFLVVIHVTLVMIIVALADAAVITVVSYVFGNPTSQPHLAQYIFSPIAGLNLGKYERAVAHAGDVTIETYAASGVERAFPKGPRSHVRSSTLFTRRNM